MHIHVDAKIEGKYPSIQSGKLKYNITQELLDQVEVDKTYSVVTKPRNVHSKKDGKTYTFQDIVAVLGEAEEEKPVSNVKEEHIRENMDIKNKAIAKVAALNNATAMVTAVSTMISHSNLVLTVDEAQNILVAIKEKELKDNFELLGLE